PCGEEELQLRAFGTRGSGRLRAPREGDLEKVLGEGHGSLEALPQSRRTRPALTGALNGQTLAVEPARAVTPESADPQEGAAQCWAGHKGQRWWGCGPKPARACSWERGPMSAGEGDLEVASSKEPSRKVQVCSGQGALPPRRRPSAERGYRPG